MCTNEHSCAPMTKEPSSEDSSNTSPAERGLDGGGPPKPQAPRGVARRATEWLGWRKGRSGEDRAYKLGGDISWEERQGQIEDKAQKY